MSITRWIAAYLERLRFPTLFKLTALVAAVSWLWPFDPLPFVDEMLSLLALAVLARWRRPDPPPTLPPDQR